MTKIVEQGPKKNRLGVIGQMVSDGSIRYICPHCEHPKWVQHNGLAYCDEAREVVNVRATPRPEDQAPLLFAEF